MDLSQQLDVLTDGDKVDGYILVPLVRSMLDRWSVPAGVAAAGGVSVAGPVSVFVALGCSTVCASAG